MTEDNAKKKLTLSGKPTLTLKLGANVRPQTADGKKMVQVEVRKKRTIGPKAAVEDKKTQIDEETAAKLKLIAEAKEFDNKRRQEEEERYQLRQKQKEEEELRRQKEQEEEQRRSEEKARQQAQQEEASSESHESENRALNKFKERQRRDFDDDEDEDYGNRQSKRAVSREEVFEQERKKQITKRSFEPQRRQSKVNIHNIGTDDDDDDYGFGGPRRRFKKKQPKPVVQAAPTEKVIKEVVIPEIITVQELANRMAEKSAEVIKKLMARSSAISLNVLPTVMSNRELPALKIHRISYSPEHRWLRSWGMSTTVKHHCLMRCVKRMLRRKKPAVLRSISVLIRLRLSPVRKLRLSIRRDMRLFPKCVPAAPKLRILWFWLLRPMTVSCRRRLRPSAMLRRPKFQ